MKLALAVGLSVSLVACLGGPSSENGQNTDGNPGVSIRPMFLCGEGRAVVSVEADGSVKCAAPVLKGMAAKDSSGGNASCGTNETLEWKTVGPTTNPILLPLCNAAENTNPDSVTLGAGPAEPFSCPQGSALRGFSDDGEPICRSLVGRELLDAALFVEPDQCPWGMLTGQFDHSAFSAPTCISDGRSPVQLRLMGQIVTRVDSQKGQECNDDKVVVGFTEDHDLICAKAATGFRQNPGRYWTTKFDGHPERPLCRSGYHSEPVQLRRASGIQALIKVWTCVLSI